MKDPVVIYHWWAEEAEQPAYSNISHPVLLSIATLRAVNKDIPIKVFNFSEYQTTSSEWIHFQEKLNFEVHKSNFFLEKYSHVKGYELLSRLFDIRQSDSSVIYCDTDVFWMKDPLPLEYDGSKFSFDGFNSGFFYYDYESPAVKEMFDIFDAYTITALNDKDFCQIIKEKEKIDYEPWYYIWDEIILTYMSHNGMEHLFDIIPLEEHGIARTLYKTDKSKLKMLHCNGLVIKNPTSQRVSEIKHSRGLACLLFKELYSNICKILDEKDLELIFTKEKIKDCLAMQISLFDIEENSKKDGVDYIITVKSPIQWV
jgi:hypothetical protein